MGWEEQWDEVARKGQTGLDLAGEGLNDTAAAAIAERLATDTTLTYLNLSGNQIGDIGASNIAEALATNTALTTLDLDNNHIGDIGASKIGESLATNTTLTHLRLYKNQIGDVGAIKIVEWLATNTNLTLLGLDHSKINSDVVTCINVMISWNKAAKEGKTELSLSSKLLDDAALNAIAKKLATDTTLIKLDLSNNEIGDIGASKIGESLVTNTALTYLRLGYNRIGDVGASKIGESLAINRTLTTLSLMDNEIGDIGAKSIGEALATNTALTWFDLCGNQIGDIGASTIAESLATNTTLTELYLRDNQIGDIGASKIAESLAINTTLTTLSLDNNKVTEPGMRALARSQLNRASTIDFGSDTNQLVNPILAQLKRDQEVWNRLNDDLVPAKAGKVILCGRWGAGKTTLRQSLEALGNSLGGGRTKVRPAKNTVQSSDGRTIGMEVVRVKCGDGSGNVMMVHDIGGQDEFHVQHDRIMGDESAIFVILCNLAAETVVDGNSVRYDAFHELHHLKYWLGYILMHNETMKKPRVLIVGTRGLGRQSEAANLMQLCVATYHDTLDLHPTMYCIDASLPRDDNMKAFWKDLQSEVKTKMADAKIPRLCAKIVENQSKWGRTHGFILRWEQFVTCMTGLVAVGSVFDEYLMDVCEFLHRHGNAMFFRENAHLNQFIVLNPTEFSQTIGTLLAPSSLGTDRPSFNAGVCSLKEICNKFPNLTPAEVVKMLDHFELAYELPSETLLFPVHLPRRFGSTPVVCADPRLDMDLPPILLCRRFASRSDVGRMTHGTFPRFQVRLHRDFGERLQLQQHYGTGVLLFSFLYTHPHPSNLAHISNAAEQVFATLIYHELEGVVDMAVWGQPNEVYQLAGKLRDVLYEDHMLLLRMHEQAISAQMTFDGVAWPLPVAVGLNDLNISALVDWYVKTPNHLRNTIQANHRCERVAALLHGHPAWGTGQRGISLEDFYDRLIVRVNEAENALTQQLREVATYKDVERLGGLVSTQTGAMDRLVDSMDRGFEELFRFRGEYRDHVMDP